MEERTPLFQHVNLLVSVGVLDQWSYEALLPKKSLGFTFENAFTGKTWWYFQNSRRYYCHMEECTCCLFLMEPFPSTAILVIVSSCNLFIELPFGPSNFPTKLNFGCSLTGTTTRTLRRIGFSWYMSTILVSLPGGFPPRWILAISKMRKNENQY